MSSREYSTKIKYKELREWLFEFNCFVNESAYEKMPYDVWRHLNKSRPDSSYVFIDWNGKVFDMYFPSDPLVHTFAFDDNGFGSFVFEEYLENDAYLDACYMTSDGNIHPCHERTILTQGTSSQDYTVKNLDFDNVRKTILNHSEKSKDSVERVTLVSDNRGVWAPIGDSVSAVVDTKVDKAEFDAFKDYINAHIIENEKENENMNAFKFDFGPVNANTVRMSMYGLAVKNKVGTWVSYDAKAGEIMDADMFNFDGANFLYKMPVAMKDIAVGDVVIHHGAPMFVVGKSTDGKGLIVIDVIAGERKEVMLAKSPFGFNFATKVVNFLGNAFNSSANADNPFGNMWMLMAMSDDNKDMNDMLPFMMMANDGNIDTNMLMFMAMSGKGGNDMLPMLMMMNMNAPVKTEVHQCHCGGNCGEHHE